MTQVFSTAHTFHYKWFVQLVRIHSNQKSVSKLDMVWFQIHLSVLHQQTDLHQQVLTSTTENLQCQTFCKTKVSLPSGNTKKVSNETFFLSLNWDCIFPNHALLSFPSKLTLIVQCLGD